MASGHVIEFHCHVKELSGPAGDFEYFETLMNQGNTRTLCANRPQYTFSYGLNRCRHKSHDDRVQNVSGCGEGYQEQDTYPKSKMAKTEEMLA